MFSARPNDRLSCVCCSVVNVQDITMKIMQLRKTKAQKVLRLTKPNEVIRVEMDFAQDLDFTEIDIHVAC